MELMKQKQAYGFCNDVCVSVCVCVCVSIYIECPMFIFDSQRIPYSRARTFNKYSIGQIFTGGVFLKFISCF